MNLSFPNQMADRRCSHHYLQRGHPTPSHFFAQGLGNDGLDGLCQLGADLGLLSGRTNVNDAVNGLGSAGGVKCSKDQIACLSSRDGQLDGLQIAHFTYQNKVRILTECAAQRVGEGMGVIPQFPLLDQTFFGGVHEFDGIFNG